MVAFSLYLLYGVVTMEVPDGTDFPGPQFFPMILVVVGLVLAALLVLHYLRNPEVPEDPDPTGPRYRTFTDWSAVAWCVGGFILFTLVLEVLGWILAAALLFWCVARGIGSRRPVFDLSLGLLLSSLIYIAFVQGLSLNLPVGFLGGI
ncbi:tripartite tricarboxylate transporter TctB family protein [Ornithinimicrobium avium]|uniref:Tripartite tricarboxylate transporter TctB family protein n=2 Tax=Ornithinimicrobium avium TaxID=2283195 RepID=A0A345NS86_9MICO|nr:tripartite tricarboxylate transporter TctB family protein [Ornithinimicrobium avium]